ncbi:MAG: class B sortase [Lachnospiraceae bacterium]|nr:class B sortase [Lachnospiraceae bacterium]
MAGRILKLCDSLLTLFLALILIVFGAYAAYALWDNHQVYAEAENVQDALLKIKPVIDAEGDGGASFEELLAINEDVCGWITLDNTEIDYPIVQGENILSYINTDVYGNTVLSGSIFLDPTNNKDFQDAYCLIYGHHMNGHLMFGDLDLYEDEDFFAENTTGTLILPDRSYRLEIFACLLVVSSEDAIFSPSQWADDVSGLLEFAEASATYLHEETIAALREDENPQVLGLSTCSTEFTDARTVILARMVPYSQG